jgi:hypothetical protein
MTRPPFAILLPNLLNVKTRKKTAGSIDGGRHLVELNGSVFVVGRKAEAIDEAALSDL